LIPVARAALFASAVALAAIVSAAPARTAAQTPPASRVLVGRRAPAPVVRVFTPPDFFGSYAIWGATGHDPRGHVWFGVTSNDGHAGSAHLYELDPESGSIQDRGNVVNELTRLGLRRPGEVQLKIHSRIVEGPDGYQYFSSMDESGEEADGSKYPTWGGHLWRRGSTGAWEHLAATREALIAVATGGQYVYALGYFNHVLYQFDTRSKQIRSVTVGSAGGHVSRNFFVDRRGHAFVPRITEGTTGRLAASLVELDAGLKEVAASPLAEYFERGRDDSHGIVAAHPGPGGSWFFATGKGRLYHLALPAAEGGPATVEDIGWFHPGGSRYVASMFRDDATGALFGVAYASNYGSDQFEWVRRLPRGPATVAPFPYGTEERFPHGAVLYGSMTRDQAGRFYVVGSMNYKPLVLQVTPAGPATTATP
jgi:hypothetical protein